MTQPELWRNIGIEHSPFYSAGGLGKRGLNWICVLNARVKSLANISTDICIWFWFGEHLPSSGVWWVFVQCQRSSIIWINAGISPGAFASVMMFALNFHIITFVLDSNLIGKRMNFQNKYKPNLEILLRDFLGRLILAFSEIQDSSDRKRNEQTKKMVWLLVFTA